MPAALLKQSKDFRFLTLRRRGRPFSEIASAAGKADACVFLRFFRTAQFAAAPLRRTAVAFLPPSANSTPKKKPIRVIPNFSFLQKEKFGISSDNHPFEMPILARRLGGMTQRVAVRQDYAGRSLAPAEARYSHSLIGRTTAGHGPNNLAAARRYLRRRDPHSSRR